MQPHIGIQSQNLARVAQLLNALLADECLLSLKTKKAHWNVEGVDFHEKHHFFEEQYNQLNEIIDDIAERNRTIGHYAVATMKEFLQLTRLTEHATQKNNGKGFAAELLQDHESMVIHFRETLDRIKELHDEGTLDFITGLIEKHEKMAWMLREQLS